MPWWILLAGGVGISLGLAMWGYRVMSTIGTNMTKLTPSRGFNIGTAPSPARFRYVGRNGSRAVGHQNSERR